MSTSPVVPRSPEGFPMAPSQEVWDALSPADREAVLAQLPGEVTDAEMSPPEGDRHFRAKVRSLDALRSFYARTRRKVYLAAELPVYYPAERRFAPDLLAVFDAEDHERDRWVVSAEGRGLDWVMEIHVGGDRKKDAERNVERYARLGIPEYFLFDRARGRLAAYRLPEGGRVYAPIVPQGGLYESRALGLELAVEEGRLRFYAGTAVLLESDELVHRLEAMVGELEARAAAEAKLREEEARLREEQQRLREEQQRLREEAEAELARLREELKRRGG